MMVRVKPMNNDKAPFTSLPESNKPSRFRSDPPHASATWLKPRLVCEVSYAEITQDGVMRHPSFEGMREDKAAKDVHAEKAKPTEEVVGDRKTLLNPSDDTQKRKVNGHELKSGNLNKVFWPKEATTNHILSN